jgi:hypothetical protein
MPASFEELLGSPKFAVSRDGNVSYHREFTCAWSDRFTFFWDLWGRWINYGGTSILVTAPANLGYIGLPNYIADNVNCQPYSGGGEQAPTTQTFGISGGENNYTLAHFTVDYKPFPGSEDNSPDKPDVPEGTYLEFSSEVSSEFLTLPGNKLYWGTFAEANKLPDEVNGGIQIGSEDFQLTWSRVPVPPWSAIEDKKGKVNSSTFMGHAAGHVLFMGASRRRMFQLQDTALWTIGYHFKTRSEDWRKQYRTEPAGNAGWEFVVDADNNKLYETTSFDSLFQFG